jgi:transcriptional regulator with XRE-family HTH domain
MVKGGEKEMGVGNTLKEMRGDQSQLQLSMELNVSRESVSAYETERAKLPVDVSQKLMEKYDHPFYAMAVASEYTAGAWVGKLNGDNIDLHRASVRSKTKEELNEALEAIMGVCLANPPKGMKEHQKREYEAALMQAMDAIVALTHYVAIACKEYGFSWLKLWRSHRAKLKAAGYVK